MGCVSDKEKDERDKEVETEIEEARLLDIDVTKLLLLGSGGSGKSTFFKQLQNIHGSGFAQRDRSTYKAQVYEQIIDAMKVMIHACEDMCEEHDSKSNNEFAINEHCMDAVEYVLSVRSHSSKQLSDELVCYLRM